MSKTKQSSKIIKFSDLMDSVWDFTIRDLEPFEHNFVQRFKPTFERWNSNEYSHDVYICVNTDEEIRLGNLIKDKIALGLSSRTGFDFSQIQVNFGYHTQSNEINYECLSNGESSLLCPNCGSNYLHHSMEEDAIAFWCENCHADPILNVKQHKGWTMIYWEYFKTIPT